MAVNTKYQDGGGNAMSYAELLSQTQQYISHDCSHDVVVGMSKNDENEERKGLVSRIERFLISGRITSADEKTTETAAQLYEDMAGMSFLAKYLNHLDKHPTLEEININAWNSVVLHYSGGKKVFSKESFLSPQHAVDIIRKIVARHGSILNDAVPVSISYITENIRITALKYPLVPEDIGVNASIRITRPSSISEDALLKSGSVSHEIIDFLLTCIKYMVSMCVAGKMGSGKTTVLNYLLTKLPDSARIVSIEEGSRELGLCKFDDEDRLSNQVLSLLTHPDESNKALNFDASRLLEAGLRLNADYFVPQEMRSREAYVAVEAARTGSAVLTTIHSNDAESTYSRVVTLMQKSPDAKGFDEDTLMKQAVEAFPLVVYMRKLSDETRRVMEVLESEDYIRGKGLVCRIIYRYVVEDNVVSKSGVKVKGHFEKVNGISPRLQRILLNNGAPRKLVDKYAEKEE